MLTRTAVTINVAINNANDAKHILKTFLTRRTFVQCAPLPSVPDNRESLLGYSQL